MRPTSASTTHAPDLDHVVNASPKAAPLPDALVARVAGHYRGVYDAVAARFPGVDLGALWPSSRVRLTVYL